MVHKKRQSKRLTLKKKYFIEKKVREHHRKLRREAKKNPHKRKGLKKDPGVPNLYPFKQQFVEKLERMKEKQERDVERQKEQRAKEHERRRQMNIQDMRESARRREQNFAIRQAQKEAAEKEGRMDLGDSSRRAYYREFKKVVAAADVILEVLDARDPLGCRCPEIEQSILATDPNKKIILILNKIDLVPGENVERWLKYLRSEFPTLAFKCSTQKQKRNIGHNTASLASLGSTDLLQTSECLGAETLLQLLKNYSRSVNIKTSVTVGIIGYPNVGKSSLINSLKRSRAVGVGSTPGLTKAMQEVHIDKNVKLLDCPGIVFSSQSSDSDLILRNCVKLEQLDDPLTPVEAILKRVKREKILEIYCIPKYEDSKEFLGHIARKTGKLCKGGIPNYDKAAKQVLMDWNAGKIPFYSEPPERVGVHVGASIVSTWAREMNLDDVMEQERSTVISTLKPSSSDNYIVFNASNFGTIDQGFVGDEGAEEEDLAMDEDEGEDYEDEEEEDGEEYDGDEMEDDDAVNGAEGDVLDPSSLAYQKMKMRDEEDSLNPQVNKKLQRLLKQKKKKGMDDGGRIVLPKLKTSYGKGGKSGDGEEAFSFAAHFVADNELSGEKEDDDDEEEDEEEDGEGPRDDDEELFDVDDVSN